MQALLYVKDSTTPFAYYAREFTVIIIIHILFVISGVATEILQVPINKPINILVAIDQNHFL